MSDDLGLDGVKPVYRLVGVEWQGTPLEVDPPVARLFVRLLQERKISYPDDSAKKASLKVYMCKLREAIADSGLPFSIRSIRGYGYEIAKTEDEEWGATI